MKNELTIEPHILFVKKKQLLLTTPKKNAEIVLVANADFIGARSAEYFAFAI